MDEVKFVLKCFIFSALLLAFTQIKTGDVTIENRIETVLINATMADFVNKAADGGAKLIKDGIDYARENYLNWRQTLMQTATQISTEAQIATQAQQVVTSAKSNKSEEMTKVNKAALHIESNTQLDEFIKNTEEQETE